MIMSCFYLYVYKWKKIFFDLVVVDVMRLEILKKFQLEA